MPQGDIDLSKNNPGLTAGVLQSRLSKRRLLRYYGRRTARITEIDVQAQLEHIVISLEGVIEGWRRGRLVEMCIVPPMMLVLEKR